MSNNEPKIWWLLYFIVVVPVVLLSFGVLIAGPLLFSEQLGLLVIPLWVGWWVVINRVYEGWGKIKEVRREIEQQQLRVLEASKDLQLWKPGPNQGTLGDPTREQLRDRLNYRLGQLGVARAILPSTANGWFRVLLMKADPPGIEGI